MRRLFLTDDYFSVLSEGGERRSFTYKRNPSVCMLARKLINAASSDAPASFFECGGDVSVGKRIALLDSAEVSQCEVLLRSRFNTSFSEIISSDSVISRLCARIIDMSESLSPEKMKEEEFTGWGRPDFVDLSRTFGEEPRPSAESEPDSPEIRGELYSVSLMKDRCEFILISGVGFRKVLMPLDLAARLKSAFDSFLGLFRDNFTEMQYKRLLFLANRCKRCGDCCKIYEVEVNEFEQERIASFLEMPLEEFRRGMLHENRFSWNEFSFMLNKENGYGTRCVFQGRCPDGLYGCKIYPVRPEVCRKFLPSLGKCVLNRTLPGLSEVFDSLVSFTMTRESCSFDTEMTSGNRINPVILDVNPDNLAFAELVAFFDSLAEMKR